MYRSSKFVSKFEVVKCTKLWKFNLKLCTNVLIILIWLRFQNCWMNKIVETEWKIKERTKSLSSTCSTANISVAMVDISPPKLMHKLSRDALHPWKRCITKDCISVYSRECGSVLLVKAQQCRAVEQHM